MPLGPPLVSAPIVMTVTAGSPADWVRLCGPSGLKVRYGTINEHEIVRYGTVNEHEIVRYGTVNEHEIVRYGTVNEHEIVRYGTVNEHEKHNFHNLVLQCDKIPFGSALRSDRLRKSIRYLVPSHEQYQSMNEIIKKL
jgi:hypothetical protein